MQVAPPFPHCQSGEASAAPVVIDRDLAAGLLTNFLNALDADEEAQRAAFMQYARVQAERQLTAWGVAR